MGFLLKVVSGGQTGVDQAALRAARLCGLRTGGWMPRGWRTDAGPNPKLAAQYGLKEHAESDYPPRTLLNVQETMATLIMGRLDSAGCQLTLRCCKEHHKPCLRVPLDTLERVPSDVVADMIVNWLNSVEPAHLNVAGNRERILPGIGARAESILVNVFRRIE